MRTMKPPKPRPRKDFIRATPPPTNVSISPSRSRSSTPAGHQNPKCKACDSEDLERDETGVVCRTCGTVQEEDPNYRAEVEFDETAAGAPMTRGVLLRDGQSHQRQYINRIPGATSAPGHESMKAVEKAMKDVESVFQLYATNLNIHALEVSAAKVLFRMAHNNGYYRGRTLHTVALVCLYLAIRRQSRIKYPLMLIDFAEINNYNVFDLGQIVQDLQKKFYLTNTWKEWQELDDALETVTTPEARRRILERQAELRRKDKLAMIGPENLISKFCSKLDFGDLEQKVANDAVRVAKSMNRDWMTDGRRPAGVAGAAIIIAARMNNFRRTLREIVLVAKVTELTVGKRIEEFKETKPSTFSVKEFREHDLNSIQGTDVQDPPAYYQAQPEWQANKPKRKRGRPRKHPLPETATSLEESKVSGSQNDGQPSQKRARIDADGFAVPELPIRSSTEASSPVPRGPGRPPGAKNWQAPPPTAAELEEEQELTEDIQDQLARNASLDPLNDAAVIEEGVEQKVPGTGVTEMYPAPNSKDPAGPAVNTSTGNIGAISLSPTLRPDEFEDDEDVANCSLTEAERRIKETIWVTENAEWLRNEHIKKIKRELKEREMREKGIDPEEEKRAKNNRKRKDGMSRSRRAGDVNYLEEARRKASKAREGSVGGGMAGAKAEQGEDGVDEADGGDFDAEQESRRQRQPSADARQTMLTMLKQRGTFSRRVDYESLSNAYRLPGMDDSDDSRSQSSESRFIRPYQSRGLPAAAKRRARDSVKALRQTSVASGASTATRRTSASASASASPPADVREAEEASSSASPEPIQTQTRTRRQTRKQLSPRASTTTTRAGRAAATVVAPKASQAGRKAQSKVAMGEESEGEDDDYWNEDEDDDPDRYFGAGDGDDDDDDEDENTPHESSGLGEEEEVVEDDE